MLLRNEGLFPVSRVQLAAGVRELGGSAARQLAQAGRWKYSIPWMSCTVCEGALAGGQEYPLFSGSLVFFGSSVKSTSSVLCSRCSDTGCKSVIRRSEKSCIVYSLFCIIVVIIIIIIINTVSFVA